MDVYELGLEFCNYIYLTEVDLRPDSNYKFPKINHKNWELIFESEQKKNMDKLKFKYLTYIKFNQ